jgi:GAF domain-containing protein
MAEETPDLRGLPKSEAYTTLESRVDAVLEGIVDPIAGMATICALLHHGFGHLWTGFYRVVEPGKLLRIGPYQGTLGCLDITFGKGVCGTAAARGASVLVDDVREFPGHIACDARALSEIVVPVFDRQRRLIAVLDIDSDRTAAFDAEDQAALEHLMKWFARND